MHSVRSASVLASAVLAALALRAVRADVTNIPLSARRSDALQVAASSEPLAAHGAANLVDGVEDDVEKRWLSDQSLDQSVTFTLGPGWKTSESFALSSYRLANVGVGTTTGSNSGPGRMPASWVLEGRAREGDAWRTLDVRTDEDWSEYEGIAEHTAFGRTYAVATSGACRQWRIRFSARYDKSAFTTYAYQLSEVQLFGQASDTPAPDLAVDVVSYFASRGELDAAVSSSIAGSAANLFDGSYTLLKNGQEGRWNSGSAFTQTVTFGVPEAKRKGYDLTVTSYGLYSVGVSQTGLNTAANRMPRAWTLEGCDTNAADAAWTVLDTRTNEDWSAFANVAEGTVFGRLYTNAVARPFAWYRLRFTERFGGSSAVSCAYQFTEIPLCGRLSWSERIEHGIVSPQFGAIDEGVSASSEPLSDLPASNLLNADMTSDGRWVSDACLTQTVTVAFDRAILQKHHLDLNSYTLHSVGVGAKDAANCAAGRMPSAWTLEGSSDGRNWRVLDERRDEDWSAFANVASETAFSRTFSVGQRRRVYRYLRLCLTERYGGTSFSNYAYQLTGLRACASEVRSLKFFVK